MDRVLRVRFSLSLLTFLVFASVIAFASHAQSSSAASLQCKDLFPEILLKPKKASSTKARKYKPRPTTDYFMTIADGRQIFLQLMPPAKADMPTLLMMPGGFRSWLMPEEHMQAFAAEGFGIATFNLSVQPLSVATLKPGVEPASSKADYKLKDFASEIEFVAHQLSAQGIKNLVPISLSLSSMMAAQSSLFDFVIDTCPVTSTGAQLPKLEEGRRLLKAMELANPFFGPAYTRATLDKGYREHSQSQVKRLAEHFVLPEEKHSQMTEAFVKMWRAVEGFTWESTPPIAKQQHIFIIGSLEQPSLLKHQLETFRRMLLTEDNALMYFVEGGDHFLPMTKPQAYVRIITELIQAKTEGALSKGILIIDEKSGQPRNLEGKEAIAFIDALLKTL